MRAPYFFALWGIPFVLIGLCRTVKSLSLRNLAEISLRERWDGTGTITFGPIYPNYRWLQGVSWPGLPSTPAFELIPRPRDLYETLRSAQQNAT
jgi:hypothetical protein